MSFRLTITVNFQVYKFSQNNIIIPSSSHILSLSYWYYYQNLLSSCFSFLDQVGLIGHISDTDFNDLIIKIQNKTQHSLDKSLELYICKRIMQRGWSRNFQTTWGFITICQNLLQSTQSFLLFSQKAVGKSVTTNLHFPISSLPDSSAVCTSDFTTKPHSPLWQCYYNTIRG